MLSVGRVSRRITIATFFGILIFLSKIFLPTPLDKILIFPQAVLLTLSYLIIGFPGATYTGLIGGLLTAIWRAPLAIFTIVFALIYGLLIDTLCQLMHAKFNGEVHKKRLVIAITVSTAIIGLLSYYVTVYIFRLLPRNLMLEIGILIAGTINGLVAGYVAILIWNRIKKLM